MGVTCPIALSLILHSASSVRHRRHHGMFHTVCTTHACIVESTVMVRPSKVYVIYSTVRSCLHVMHCHSNEPVKHHKYHYSNELVLCGHYTSSLLWQHTLHDNNLSHIGINTYFERVYMQIRHRLFSVMCSAR